MVPISSDSMSSTWHSSRFRCWHSMAAASHPEVPPPMITIFDNGCMDALPVPILEQHTGGLRLARGIVIPIRGAAGLNGPAEQVDSLVAGEADPPGEHQGALRHWICKRLGRQQISRI